MDVINSKNFKRYQIKLKKSAQAGNFSTQMRIFPYEVGIFEKNGLEVAKISIFSKETNRKMPYDIFWSSPFDGDVPSDVVDYINGIIDNLPEVENLAQFLYIVAMRANSNEE